MRGGAAGRGRVGCAKPSSPRRGARAVAAAAARAPGWSRRARARAHVIAPAASRLRRVVLLLSRIFRTAASPRPAAAGRSRAARLRARRPPPPAFERDELRQRRARRPGSRSPTSRRGRRRHRARRATTPAGRGHAAAHMGPARRDARSGPDEVARPSRGCWAARRGAAADEPRTVQRDARSAWRRPAGSAASAPCVSFAWPWLTGLAVARRVDGGGAAAALGEPAARQRAAGAGAGRGGHALGARPRAHRLFVDEEGAARVGVDRLDPEHAAPGRVHDVCFDAAWK